MIRIQQAQPSDRAWLNQLLHNSDRTHTHLDWHTPQAWLGAKPFYLTVKGEHPIAAMAAPPNPVDTSWIRLAVVMNQYDPQETLDLIWQPTLATLRELKTERVACMLLNDWFAPVLKHWAFTQVNDVVVLQRVGRTPKSPTLNLNGITLRAARESDLPAIYQVDTAFVSPWHYSIDTLAQAMTQVELTSVAELNGELVGYQMSSGGRSAGHLARLAVNPKYQARGIGRALVQEVTNYFDRLGAPYITVNTQHDNHSSLAVYRACGFEQTKEHYPVWVYEIN